jgi:hypothetical protein
MIMDCIEPAIAYASESNDIEAITAAISNQYAEGKGGLRIVYLIVLRISFVHLKLG